MSYNEKLQALSSSYGMTTNEYVDMMTKKIYDNGVLMVIIIGVAVGLFLIGLVIAFFYFKKEAQDKLVLDFLASTLSILFIVNIGLLGFTGVYTDPYDDIFNTEYEVVKYIKDCEKCLVE